MSFFSSGAQTEKFGLIVDVGSGSALVAIVHSVESDFLPTIVWYVREYSALRNIESTSENSKAVTTALMNALLRLDGEGRKVLSAYRSDAKISEIQVTISAPWSYTITKNINYTQEKPFLVTEELVAELVRSALKKTEEELSESESVSQLGLEVVTRTTLSLLANDYKISVPVGNEASTVSLAHSSVVTQKYLVESLTDLQKKLFPKSDLRMISYILTMFCVSKDLFPHLQESCLVDTTYEATEIGIVREGSLVYSTHTPFGLFSLAREISAITKSPLQESLKYLHGEKPYSFMESITAKQKTDVELVFEAYIEKLGTLFTETGDALSIPKQIILQTDAGTETLMKDIVEKAIKRAIKTNPAVSTVASKLTAKRDSDGNTEVTDTAMLIAARFFHKRKHCLTFEYL